MASHADESKLPYQMDVYFDAFPEVDAERLQRFIQETDPAEEEECEIECIPVQENERESLQVGGFTVSLGDLIVAALTHSMPSPAAEVIEYSKLQDDVKSRMSGHKAFALLTALGGEEYSPYEKQILLIKIAMGLCEQGALGASFLHTGLCLPGELLTDMAQANRKLVAASRDDSLWLAIREDGQLRQMFAYYSLVDAAGCRWLVSRGFAFCGFPDLIAKVTQPDDLDQMAKFYDLAFSYMMQNGPVIEAGDTMGYDEKVAIRFSEVPKNLELPFPTFGLLQAAREHRTDASRH